MFLATNKNNVHSCLCSFNGAPQAEEEVKDKGERRHSHTILSMTDSLTLPLLSSPTSLPRTSKTNMGKYLCVITLDLHHAIHVLKWMCAADNIPSTPFWFLTSTQPCRWTSKDDSIQQHPNAGRLSGAVRSIAAGQHSVAGWAPPQHGNGTIQLLQGQGFWWE